MIKKITINNIASYKKETSLETDKKINLVYGLNGTGKTTLSNYLKSLSNDFLEDEFKDCDIEDFNKSNQKILVYNQKFIEENFYNSETQLGIFTLSKDNKEAKENIDKANEEKSKLEGKINNQENGLNIQKQNKEDEITLNLQQAENSTWNIIQQDKKVGDNIFDKNNFFRNLNSKKNLFNHLSNLELKELNKNIDEIKRDLQELEEATENRQELSKIENNILNIEKHLIFQEVIIGNQDNTISNLINKFKNSDWVKQGLDYVNLEERKNCPFCQEETLTNELVENIKNYFDETYDSKKQQIKDLKINYENFKNNLKIENYKKDFFTEEKNLEIKNLFKDLEKILDDNLKNIENKINEPSQKVELKSSEEAIKKINSFIENRNEDIKKFNEKLANRNLTIENLKTEFWKTQRKEYNQTIINYREQNKKLKNDKDEIEKKIKDTNSAIDEQKRIISENQTKITDIEETIEQINKYLLDFGIQNFKIEKNEDDKKTYKIERENKNSQIFKSLSEGEKTIISFLYFVELCKGLENQQETKQKIIVIDDPISSLSHMFVFNVAQLIKTTFFNNDNNFLQCFILTHSLYFFHELVDKKDRQKEENNKNQKLFRITKTDTSKIEKMGYNEIQNEYESYWYIVKTGKEENRFIVANAMRNIIEHFFGFIGKQDNINNIFNQEGLKDNKYQFFKRYMDRESHSDRINLTDYKEFNLKIFKNAFEKVFEIATEYKNHYEKMIK